MQQTMGQQSTVFGGRHGSHNDICIAEFIIGSYVIIIVLIVIAEVIRILNDLALFVLGIFTFDETFILGTYAIAEIFILESFDIAKAIVLDYIIIKYYFLLNAHARSFSCALSLRVEFVMHSQS